MATLVFDIETSALSPDVLDEDQQAYLFRELDSLEDPEAKEKRREHLTRMMSLWPLTSQCVCIAMINADTRKGQVLYLADDFEAEEDSDPRVAFIPSLMSRSCSENSGELLKASIASSPSMAVVLMFPLSTFDRPS